MSGKVRSLGKAVPWFAYRFFERSGDQTGLSAFADDGGTGDSTGCPTGKSPKTPSSPPAKNIPPSRLTQITALTPSVSPQMRGGSRSSRTLRWDAMDAAVRMTKRAACGRRSRVVLTSRRWRQVGDDISYRAGDGGKKARSPRRARRKPLKPLRGEGRMIRAHLWRLHSCAF